MLQTSNGESRKRPHPIQAIREIFSINLAMKREFNPDLKPEAVTLTGASAEQIEHTDLLQMVRGVLLERDELAHLTSKLMEAKPGDAGMESLMRKFLPFLDSLERILFLAREFPPSEEINNWLTGVESLYYRLVNTLEKHGLNAIKAVGHPVDLDCQEVVEYVNTAEHPHHHVIKERHKGYYFQGKLLRDAQVVVANNPQRS